jgi:hypothetical protein
VNQVDILLNQEEHRLFQNELIKNPEMGDLLKGTSGARKARVRVGKKGKSGGARVIYYYKDQKNQIWMLAIYNKKDKSNLTHEETNMIKGIVEQIKKYSK